MGGRFHGRNNPPKEKKPLKDTFDLKTLRMKFRAKIAAAMAVAFAFATQTVHAQNVGVKANALSFAHTALGMGAEMSLGYHWSTELYGVISPWKRTEDKAKKYWAVQPEVRYWPCQAMVGHFFGVHVDGAQYNVGGAAPFFGLPKSVKDALRRLARRRWCDLWLPMGAGAPLERGGSSKRRLRAPALQEV